jgi:hypothetical protein
MLTYRLIGDGRREPVNEEPTQTEANKAKPLRENRNM